MRSGTISVTALLRLQVKSVFILFCNTVCRKVRLTENTFVHKTEDFLKFTALTFYYLMLKGIWKRKACKTTCLKERLYFPIYFPCSIKETAVKARNHKWLIFNQLSMLFLVITYMIFMHFSTKIRNSIHRSKSSKASLDMGFQLLHCGRNYQFLSNYYGAFYFFSNSASQF